MVERGNEGYVAKDERAPYEGGPTRSWLKVKQKGWTVEEDRWQRRISILELARLTAYAHRVHPRAWEAA